MRNQKGRKREGGWTGWKRVEVGGRDGRRSGGEEVVRLHQHLFPDVLLSLLGGKGCMV